MKKGTYININMSNCFHLTKYYIFGDEFFKTYFKYNHANNSNNDRNIKYATRI